MSPSVRGWQKVLASASPQSVRPDWLSSKSTWKSPLTSSRVASKKKNRSSASSPVDPSFVVEGAVPDLGVEVDLGEVGLLRARGRGDRPLHRGAARRHGLVRALLLMLPLHEAVRIGVVGGVLARQVGAQASVADQQALPGLAGAAELEVRRDGRASGAREVGGPETPLMTPLFGSLPASYQSSFPAAEQVAVDLELRIVQRARRSGEVSRPHGDGDRRRRSRRPPRSRIPPSIAVHPLAGSATGRHRGCRIWVASCSALMGASVVLGTGAAVTPWPPPRVPRQRDRGKRP